jgi:hypothetical protein
MRSQPFMRAVILVTSGMFLTACASRGPASIAGGECRVFSAPDYAIRGKAQVDQNWIDDTEEAGIAACKWSRPQARPVAKVAPHKAALIQHKKPIKKPVVKSPKPVGHIMPPTSQPEPVTVPPPDDVIPEPEIVSPTEKIDPSYYQKLQDRIRRLNDKVKRLEGR